MSLSRFGYLVEYSRKALVLTESRARAVQAVKRRHAGADIARVRSCRRPASTAELDEVEEVLCEGQEEEQGIDLTLTQRQIECLAEMVTRLEATETRWPCSTEIDLDALQTDLWLGLSRWDNADGTIRPDAKAAGAGTSRRQRRHGSNVGRRRLR